MQWCIVVQLVIVIQQRGTAIISLSLKAVQFLHLEMKLQYLKAKFKGVIHSCLHKETEPINVRKEFKIILILYSVQLVLYLSDSEGPANCLSLENIQKAEYRLARGGKSRNLLVKWMPGEVSEADGDLFFNTMTIFFYFLLRKSALCLAPTGP